jgi:hypothetical protein
MHCACDRWLADHRLTGGFYLARAADFGSGAGQQWYTERAANVAGKAVGDSIRRSSVDGFTDVAQASPAWRSVRQRSRDDGQHLGAAKTLSDSFGSFDEPYAQAKRPRGPSPGHCRESQSYGSVKRGGSRRYLIWWP